MSQTTLLFLVELKEEYGLSWHDINYLYDKYNLDDYGIVRMLNGTYYPDISNIKQ